jgi:hypothetical protein
VSDLLERAAVVKAKWTMDMVVEQLIGETVPASRKINSPFNEADETPSFHVYDDSFYDYSTGKWGDVIDLIRQLRRCSLETAVELLESEADELGLQAVERVKVEKPAFVVPNFTSWCFIADQYGELPGVSYDVMSNLFALHRIALDDQTGTLAILHVAPDGNVVGVKYRHPGGKKTSHPGSDFSSFLYQPGGYEPNRDYCIITEGETDSWAWLSACPNDHVYSLPSGAQSWRDRFLEQLNPYRQIYLAFDNDKPGKDAEDKVTRAIGWGRAEHVKIPTFYKDVREAVAAGWRPTCSAAQYNTPVERSQ